MNADRSTNEIRMIATDAIGQQHEVCKAERARIGDRVAQNTKRIQELDSTKLLAEMRETWAEFKGEVKTQIRITWALLLLVISGLIGIAFSVWGSAP
jgi:hypothetical protein